MEVPIYFLWITLRKVECSVFRDMHQAISLIEGDPQRTGPRSLNTTVEIPPD